MRRHVGYFLYVIKHKWLVFKAGRILGVPLKQLLLHDLSKFSRHEWSAYAHAFIDQWGHAKPPQRSPEYYAAWNHHQKSNPHHWQFWVLVQNNGETMCIEMPDCYAREMIADLVAVSWGQLGRDARMLDAWDDAVQWYGRNHLKMLLHEMTMRKLNLFFTEYP